MKMGDISGAGDLELVLNFYTHLLLPHPLRSLSAEAISAAHHGHASPSFPTWIQAIQVGFLSPWWRRYLFTCETLDVFISLFRLIFFSRSLYANEAQISPQAAYYSAPNFQDQSHTPPYIPPCKIFFYFFFFVNFFVNRPVWLMRNRGKGKRRNLGIFVRLKVKGAL